MFNPLQFYEFGKSRLALALPFVSTWKTNNSGISTTTQIKLPLISTGVYNFIVNWGDGTQNTITTHNQAEVTHTYSGAGNYTVSISGTIKGFNFGGGGDKSKILSVSSWGDLQLATATNQFSFFLGCSNLILSNVSDFLDLTGTTNLTEMFKSCTSLTTVNGINQWDTSSVTAMTSMFQLATNFNQPLSFNTGNVTSMNAMFSDAIKFNSLLTFNTINVISMLQMFKGSTIFNQPVNFNTSKVIDMNLMFQQATAFNQSLSFNTVKVTSMNSMFRLAINFNQNLSGFDLSLVTNTAMMFMNASNFNNGLASGLSGALAWNTINVTVMSDMFNTSNAFNQNIGSWNVSKVTNFASFMNGKTNLNFSATNLDAIYNGWSSRPVKTPITITFGTAKYTSASSSGRAILTGAPNNWVITDGGI